VYNYADFMLVSPGGKIVDVTEEVHEGLDLDEPLPDPGGKPLEKEKRDFTFLKFFYLARLIRLRCSLQHQLMILMGRL
jgi:hypothetical protein